MKRIINLLTGFSIMISIISCKKNTINPGVVSLNVIQATIDLPSVYIYITNSPTDFSDHQAIVPFMSSAEYGLAPNSPFSLVSANDTTKKILNTTLNLKSGGIYSLYLSGSTAHLDTLLLQDNIPFHSDSTAGVRFINLSPGSQPVTINLQGDPTSQTEFQALAYKGISSFKSYPATSAITSYNFEIRDQASGTLLSTFTWSLALFKNNTIVICGSEDPTSATPLSAFQVNNY